MMKPLIENSGPPDDPVHSTLDKLYTLGAVLTEDTTGTVFSTHADCGGEQCATPEAALHHHVGGDPGRDSRPQIARRLYRARERRGTFTEFANTLELLRT